MIRDKISIKKWLPIIGLTFSTFIFNTTEFIPIGLLTDIANDFNITEAHAGMLISVYAWFVMLLSLPLMLAASKMERRKLMLWIFFVFVVSHFVSAVSTNFWMLMISRIGVACAHSIFWAIVSPVAVSIVSPKYRQIALSTIVTGSSIAMIVGLPLGRVIGLLIGWRMTFLCIGLFALATMIYLIFVLPKVPSGGRFPVHSLPLLLKNPLLVSMYALALILPLGYYTCYSYIEPFMLQVANMTESTITLTLMIFGGAGMLGSIAFSKYYTRNPFRFMSIVIFCAAMCMIVLHPLSVSVYTTILACALLGAAMTAFNVSMQSEIINCSPKEATSVSMAIFSGIFNMGIACGTMVGGAICTYSTIANIGYVGGAIALLSFLFWFKHIMKLLKAWYAQK